MFKTDFIFWQQKIEFKPSLFKRDHATKQEDILLHFLGDSFLLK